MIAFTATETYHQIAYNAVNITTTPIAEILKLFSVAKLTSSKLTLVSVDEVLVRAIKDTLTISNKHKINTKLIRSIKGKSGHMARKPKENNAEPIAADNAPIDVAFLQNIPTKNITTIPGVNTPVYS